MTVGMEGAENRLNGDSLVWRKGKWMIQGKGKYMWTYIVDIYTIKD